LPLKFIWEGGYNVERALGYSIFMTLERKTGQKEKEEEQKKKKLSISVKQQQREEYPITYSISFVTARAVYTDTPTTSM
jgi:acetoin utilization deacetylase AcuC-like enzyme